MILDTETATTRSTSGSRPTRRSWAPSSGSPSRCRGRSPSGRSTARAGSEILTIEDQSGRARVLTLDQSGDRRGQQARPAGVLRACRRAPSAAGRWPSATWTATAGRTSSSPTRPTPRSGSISRSGRSGLGSGQTFPSLVGARTVHLADLDGDGKDEVYVLSEQEKQIGRSVFDKGRLSFPTPLPIAGEPVAMDVADLDGDKTPEILYVAARPSPAPTPSSCGR